MLTDNTQTNCHFCSVVSKANGEEPIGTAPIGDRWLIIEMKLPWTRELLFSSDLGKLLFPEIEELNVKCGVKLRPMLISRDRKYSRSGYTRILYYARPGDRLFAKFNKQEFIVPEAEVISLVTAIIKQLKNEPNNLPDFQQYRQQTSHIRELLICTHGNIDAACAKFGYPIYQRLRSDCAAISSSNLRVWRCSHFGGHQFAPTLLDLPEGRYWGHLELEVLELLVRRNGSISELYPFYRGWAGLSKFPQIVEREIWLKEGWNWLKYHQAGQTISTDETNNNSTQVRIDFARQDESISGYYQATVEVKGQVFTALNSAKELTLTKVDQYRVTNLTKVANSF